MKLGCKKWTVEGFFELYIRIYFDFRPQVVCMKLS